MKIAIYYKNNGELARMFNSLEEACEVTDMSVSTITDALDGYTEQAAGFIWKYFPDAEV